MITLLLLANLMAQDCAALKPQFNSVEMKKRAIRKVDIGDALKQAHAKGAVILNLTVDVDGSVRCVDFLSGPSLFRQEVERAVKQWRFRPLIENGRPVVHLGQLRFAFCNFSCGDRGTSMTLVRD